MSSLNVTCTWWDWGRPLRHLGHEYDYEDNYEDNDGPDEILDYGGGYDDAEEDKNLKEWVVSMSLAPDGIGGVYSDTWLGYEYNYEEEDKDNDLLGGLLGWW